MKLLSLEKIKNASLVQSRLMSMMCCQRKILKIQVQTEDRRANIKHEKFSAGDGVKADV